MRRVSPAAKSTPASHTSQAGAEAPPLIISGAAQLRQSSDGEEEDDWERMLRVARVGQGGERPCSRAFRNLLSVTIFDASIAPAPAEGGWLTSSAGKSGHRALFEQNFGLEMRR